jgi:hypothetical protein
VIPVPDNKGVVCIIISPKIIYFIAAGRIPSDSALEILFNDYFKRLYTPVLISSSGKISYKKTRHTQV